MTVCLPREKNVHFTQAFTLHSFSDLLLVFSVVGGNTRSEIGRHWENNNFSAFVAHCNSFCYVKKVLR